MKIAIIGTAGRDKTKSMTLDTWEWMIAAAKQEINKHIALDSHVHLVSGGAAWADHLAVHLFLTGFANELTLHLPAPVDSTGFQGGYGTSGGGAQYYHDKFKLITGVDSVEQILLAANQKLCHGSVEPVAKGYAAMFKRNAKIVNELSVADDMLIAFTFGEGDVPGSKGTKDTWDQFRGKKIHITIPEFK